MTDDERLRPTWKSCLVEWGKIAGAVSACLVAVGLVWAYTFGPVRDVVGWYQRQEAMMQSFERLVITVDKMNDKIDRLATENNEFRSKQEDILFLIDEVARPKTVFEVDTRNSGPLDGYCISRQECDYRIRVRRLSEGLDCRIVGGATEWEYFNPRTLSISPAIMVGDKIAARNLTASWQELEVTLKTPAGLEPEARLRFKPHYTECFGRAPELPALAFASVGIPTKVLHEVTVNAKP